MAWASPLIDWISGETFRSKQLNTPPHRTSTTIRYIDDLRMVVLCPPDVLQ